MENTLAGLPFLQFATLRSASAQVMDTRNLIYLYEDGGGDHHNSFFPTSGPLFNTLRSVRPTLFPNSFLQNAIPVAGQNGMSNPLAFHPNWAPALNAWGTSKVFVATSTGLVGSAASQSHNTAHVRSSSTNPGASQPRGFLAFISDLANFGAFDYWIAGNYADRIDFRTNATPPMTVPRLSTFDIQRRNFGSLTANGTTVSGARDSDHAQMAVNSLLNSTAITTQAQRLFTVGAGQLAPVIDTVRNLSTLPTVGVYDNTSFGRSFSLIARVIAYLRANPGLGGPLNIFYVSIGGFDTHSGQTDSQANLIGARARQMAALKADLDAVNAASNTLIVTSSEFGRTFRQNNSAGTDHGEGGGMMVMGGSVIGGSIGNDVDTNAALNRNMTPATVDYRQVMSEVVRWLGLSPSQVFPNFNAARIPFLP
ncbi:MAG: hypothetical protein DCC75_03245 [Proteobacteria bacterium]|nr:MAG: hypothetical protein DCC75_03245 [Pseudomonadota bacterium]